MRAMHFSFNGWQILGLSWQRAVVDALRMFKDRQQPEPGRAPVGFRPRIGAVFGRARLLDHRVPDLPRSI